MFLDFARRVSSVLTSPADERRDLSFQDIFAMGLDVDVSTSAAGKTVDRETATNLTAVYGSWRIIADNISTLDLGVFQERPDEGQVPVEERNAAYPGWLKFEDTKTSAGRIAFLTQCVLSFLSDGNVFIATSRTTDGSISRISVLDPQAVTVLRNKARGRHYEVNGKTYSHLDIFHIPGLLMPGQDRGLSPLAAAKETIGLGLAAQEFGAKFFANGALPGALIEHEKPVTDTGIRQMKRAWREIHEGSGNAHKVAVLTEGAKFKKVSLDPDEAQFIETREFTVADIARVYGIPPHLLADATKSTSWGSGLAEQNLAFGQHALRPWVARLNEGLTLLLRSDGPGVRKFSPCVRLDLESATRGSLKDQIETLGRGVRYGLMSQNEARRKLGLPPIGPEGDLVQIHQSTAADSQEETPADSEPEEGNP